MGVQVEPVAPLLVLRLLQAVPSPPHSPLGEAEAPLELMLGVRQRMSALELV